MVAKENTGAYASDGSKFGTLTDSVGTLVVTTTSSTGLPKQRTGAQAPDGSVYFTLTDSVGNKV